MNTQTYTVNIRTGVVNITRVDVSQGDTGRTLAFSLYDGLSPFTPPTGSTVTIVGRKPSKLGFSETCTVSGNVATVATTLAMTQEAGKFPAELRIEAGGQSIGTANFTMYVEPSPHPAGTTDGTTEEARTVLAQCEYYAELAQEAAEAASGDYTEIRSDVDDLSVDVSQLRADLEDLDERLDSLGDGVPTEVKQALLTLFQSAAYTETDLMDEIAVIESWASVVTAIALNQTSISISGASTNQLVATTTPAGGAVTWASSDTNVATVSNSGLVTGVGNGTATITASCGDLSATCEVTVSGHAVITGITATYTQAHTLYYDSNISDILPDLVVVANYSDSSAVTLPSDQYAVTGVFSEGTATFTVTYREFSTTFNASVTAVLYPLVQGTHTFSDGSYVTVVNNHVKCYAASAYNGSTGYQFNFLDINDNTTTSKTSTNNANNKSSKFTIPSGETCVINLSIKSNSGFYKANTSTVFVIGNREANGTANLGTTTYFGGSTNWETDQNGYVVPSDYSNQFTLEQSKNCGSYYFYNGHADAGATIEFEVQLFVGNNRYF